MQLRKEPIWQVTVYGAARTANAGNKERILNLLEENIANFLPLAPQQTRDGNLEFYVLSAGEAESAKAMSRRLSDPEAPSIRYSIATRRIPTPWETQKQPHKKLIEVCVCRLMAL